MRQKLTNKMKSTKNKWSPILCWLTTAGMGLPMSIFAIFSATLLKKTHVPFTIIYQTTFA